jgi:hypothetical protein
MRHEKGNHLGHGVAWADYTASRQKDAHGLASRAWFEMSPDL